MEVCCDKEELEAIEYVRCDCPAFSTLGLTTLVRGLFEGSNSVSRTDIKALHRITSSLRWLRSARASIV